MDHCYRQKMFASWMTDFDFRRYTQNCKVARNDKRKNDMGSLIHKKEQVLKHLLEHFVEQKLLIYQERIAN